LSAGTQENNKKGPASSTGPFIRYGAGGGTRIRDLDLGKATSCIGVWKKDTDVAAAALIDKHPEKAEVVKLLFVRNSVFLF